MMPALVMPALVMLALEFPARRVLSLYRTGAGQRATGASVQMFRDSFRSLSLS
jgi:hypothetical protein